MNTTNYTIPINLTIATEIGSDPRSSLTTNKILDRKMWQNPTGRRGAWICNSYKEWHKQFPYWSISKLRRIIKLLEDKELIFSKKVRAKKWGHTKWYSISFERFNQLFSKVNPLLKKFFQKEQIDLLKMNKS